MLVVHAAISLQLWILPQIYHFPCFMDVQQPVGSSYRKRLLKQNMIIVMDIQADVATGSHAL